MLVSPETEDRLRRILDEYPPHPTAAEKPIVEVACDLILLLEGRVEELHKLVADLRADIDELVDRVESRDD